MGDLRAVLSAISPSGGAGGQQAEGSLPPPPMWPAPQKAKPPAGLPNAVRLVQVGRVVWGAG